MCSNLAVVSTARRMMKINKINIIRIASQPRPADESAGYQNKARLRGLADRNSGRGRKVSLRREALYV